MKATEQYFPVILFIMMYKLVLTFESVHEILMTIQLKATEQYFPVMLFIMRPRWFLHSCLWMKSQSVTIQLKATEQYFPVMLFIMLHKVVLTFMSVDEIPKCDHSTESY